MKIVLIGYRGTGKTAVAQQLSGTLSLPYVSMDEEIVKRAGSSIPQIVAERGWTYFRDLETELALSLAERDGIIIDAGGGVVERPENIAALRTNAAVVWLTSPVWVILSRIASSTERPALTEGKSFTEEVEEVITRRAPLYAAAANYLIDSSRGTPAEIAERIASMLGRSDSPR